jgi:hypothetical protein
MFKFILGEKLHWLYFQLLEIFLCFRKPATLQELRSVKGRGNSFRRSLEDLLKWWKIIAN